MTFDPDWKERSEYAPLSREVLLSLGQCCHHNCRNCPYPKSMETKVVNLHNEPFDVYIGRAGKGQDGYFGNRHPIGYCYQMQCLCQHDRKSAIEAYKKDFLYAIEHDGTFLLRVLELRGKRLGCFCKPLACHGDVIKEWLDNHPSLE